MSRIVLDCSITIAWCFEDEVTEYTDSVLELLAERQARVPSIWPLEVANVLALSERKGRTNQAKVTQFLEFLNNLPIIVDAKTQETAFTVRASPGSALSHWSAHLQNLSRNPQALFVEQITIPAL